uniref:DUF8211 domain-containing protein n=1 Tax=Rhizophagus irregularis (strain DAOM 181602 / DAOM 197198 / MUCL 43194) TaxID=747089 RepID=U9UFC6_RHIID
MSYHRHACIIHHKNLVLYFISKDNKIPDVSHCKTFKNFHASRLHNRWAKKKKYQNFSNRLGISFTTSYHAYNTNVVATKKLDFIYSKKYGNLQFTPSLSPKVKKRQEAQNQQFTAPIKHLRYKKKFIEPSKGYYTFPISFPETKTVPAPAIAETICNVSSVASISNGNPISSVNTDNWENIPEHYIPLIPQSAIYEGGRLNQPSRMKIWKKNLQPLAVGSDEVTDAQYNYETKLLEILSEVIPELPTKKSEDTKILEELRSWVNIYEDAFIVNYYRDEIGLAFQPCAIMDDRPLK